MGNNEAFKSAGKHGEIRGTGGEELANPRQAGVKPMHGPAGNVIHVLGQSRNPSFLQTVVRAAFNFPS